MLMLSRHRFFLRCVSLLTALAFLPTSVQAWHFLPQVQSVVLAADSGPVPLAPDKVAELETGAETPVPLNEQKREQLAENRVVADELPRNFVERIAQAEGALPSLGLGAVPPKGETGLKAMSREELGAVASAVPLERPLRNPNLPEAASVLARIAAAVAAPPASEAKPVQVAQSGKDATLPGEREVRGPLGPQAAADALVAADALASAGHRSEALIAYFEVMDAYGNTNEALWADQGMWNALEDLAGGRLDREAVTSFETYLAQWTPNTADGAYAAATWDSERALAEHKGGNEESALTYAARAEARSLDFLHAHADSYLSMSVADYYQEIVNLQGPEKERSAMLALWDQALAMEHAPGRLGALYAFGSYAGSVEANAAAEAIIAWSNVLSEMKEPYVEELLGDSAVPFWAKGFICEYAGRSQAGLGQYSESKAWYDRGVALSSHVGPTHWFLAYMSALVTTKMYPMNPETGVDAMARYLESYPDSTYAGNAHIELGALFTLAGDYQGAAEFYNAVIQQGKNESLSAVAQHELDYLLRNLYESRPSYAKKEEENPEQRAARKRSEQFCGPMALSELLRQMDIQAEADALATLAGTDDTGTTMLGLVTAAEFKGVALHGVLASAPEELSLPAIAFVNKSHFVVVQAVRPDAVDIYDPAAGNKTLDRATFGSQWDGQALVLGSDSGAALTVAALEQKGGAGTPAAPNPNYTPYEDYVGGSGGAGFAGSDPSAITQGPNFSTPVTSPGVSLSINAFETCIDMRETDLTLGVSGPLEVEFGRCYINEKGYPRSNSTNGRMGKGWFNNLSVYILTGNVDDHEDDRVEDLVLQDSSGTARHYVWVDEVGGYDYYERTGTGQTSERGMVVRAVHTTTAANRKFYVDFPTGKQYVFSAAQSASGNSRARLDYIKDAGSANTVTFLYDSTNKSTGKLTKVQSPLGDARHFFFSYDSSSRITKAELKATSTVLQTVTYAYDSSTLLTKVTDNASKTIQYAYGTQGGSTSYIDGITDKAGHVTSLDWYFGDDASGNWGGYKIEVTPPVGATQIFDRSISSSVNTTKRNDGVNDLSKSVSTPLVGDTSRTRYSDSYSGISTYDRWEYEYNSGKDLTSSVDPLGTAQMLFSYTPAGRISTATTNIGVAIIYEYASPSALSPTKYKRGGEQDVSLQYDGSGRATKYVDPGFGIAGHVYEYDSFGELTSTTTPDGQIAEAEFNDTGRLTSKTDAGNTFSVAYDSFGNGTSITDVDNNTTTFAFDTSSCGGCGGGSLLTKRTDSNGNYTEFEYDGNGNLTKTTDEQNTVTDTFFDDMNRVTKVETPSGSGIYNSVSYDESGRISTELDMNGGLTTSYYDFQGRLTKLEDSIGTCVEYTYDSLGNIATVEDGLSHITNYNYNNAGQLTKVTDPIGNVVKYFYDGYGRKSKVGAGGTGAIDPTEYFLDANGLATKITYTSGVNTYDAVYVFDSYGRLTKLTDWIDNLNGMQYSYDSHGLLTRLTDYDGSHLDYAYDSRGRVTSINDYHGNVTSYTYASDSKLSTITAPGSKTWVMNYDDHERLTKVEYPNGLYAAYSYGTFGRLTALAYMDGGTVKQSFDYSFTNGNVLTKLTQYNGSLWDYSYDGRRRLTKAERYHTDGTTLLHRLDYVYDAADNLVSKVVLENSIPSTTTTVWAYDGANQQTSMAEGGTTTMQSYDAWGRLTSRTQSGYSASYEYRYGAKLYSAVSDFPGEGGVTYQYGADQKRRSRVSGADETWYNYAAGYDVISEEDDSDGSSGALKRTYIGRNLAHVDGISPSTGAWKYYTHDFLGSSRGVWNQDKSEYATMEYGPYGEMYASTGSVATLTRGFTGLEWDSTLRLYHAYYRNYGPEQARWLTRDPLSVDGPNLYSYVRAQPTQFVDPLGDVAQVIGTIAGVFSAPVSIVVLGVVSVGGIAWSVIKYSNSRTLARQERRELLEMAEHGQLRYSVETHTITRPTCDDYEKKKWDLTIMTNGECRCYYQGHTSNGLDLETRFRPSDADIRRIESQSGGAVQTDRSGRAYVKTHGNIGSWFDGFKKWYVPCYSQTITNAEYKYYTGDYYLGD